MRFSKEELRRFGFVEDKDGNWTTNISGVDSAKNSKHQQSVWSKPIEANKPKKSIKRVRGNSDKFRVQVTCFSWRERDTDNLSAKVWIDLLRGRIFADDSSAYVVESSLRVERIPRTEPEGTLIEVFKL